MARIALDHPDYYLNREAASLAFNRRVLEEAQDERNPMLERIRFLAISAAILDEFFEVRVAALLQRVEDGLTDSSPDGLTPAEEARLIDVETHALVEDQYRCWNEQLRPGLAEQGIRVLGLEEVDGDGKAFLNDYRKRELDPLLTPVTVDPAHPFPRVINKALCLGLVLRRRRRASGTYMGVVTVPRVLPRLIRLPSENGTDNYVFLADLVAAHAGQMYRGYEIVSAAPFRITRNSNLYVQEEESRSLLEAVRTELHNRRKGDAVRLEVEAEASAEIVDRLQSTFGLRVWQVFHTPGPVSLSRLGTIYDQIDRPDLKFRPFTPRELHLTEKSTDLFEEIRKRDILLHHPFDSYDSVVSFVESAARDPRVMSIKQTLYRTSSQSPIVHALVEAAAHKEVTVVVEVKARFDEASNIRWARELEDAGVQVFHGLVGLKTHCKMALLVRKDLDGVTRRYLHLGTGNYNPVTAAAYTDLSLLTSNEEMTSAAHSLFNFLTAYAEQPNYQPLLVAPVDLAQKTLALIARESEHARQGRPARIIAKMNALLEPSIIQELYRASQAGVEIDLIVRGMCALRPGVRGVSSRIRVRSIVGRFLEHTRIFCFGNGGNEEIYLGSADWMPRNLYERVELLFPLRDPILRQRVRDEILAAYLADTAKARILRHDGSYERVERPNIRLFSAQEFLLEAAEGRQALDSIPRTPARKGRSRTREVKA
ncbi:MAG: polyphosphate kinase 1 [Candidatus Korobacteraceae bacterium]